MEYPPPQTTSFSDNDAYVQATAYPNWDGSASECRATVPVTFTITWTGSGAAPDHVDIKTAKSVQVGRYLVYGSGGSGYGDSLGDPGGNDQNVENGVFNTTQSHARVIRLPVSSGQATFNALLDITIFSPTTTHLPDYSDSVSVVCHDKVTIDNREVNISSSLDPTYYRGTDSNGNPVPVLNARQPDGTMYGDTLKPSSQFPYNSFPVTYSAAPSGSWSQNSQYHWYSSLTGDVDSGAFNPNSIYPFGTTYMNPPVVGGQTDHIYIHLIDSGDGSDATNNYYMKFHKEYEDWVRTSLLEHPLPFYQSPYPSEDWQVRLTTIDNPSGQSQTVMIGHSMTVQHQMSGTIGGQQTLDAEGIGAFQMNEGITVGETVSYTFSETFECTAAPYTNTTFYGGIMWEERQGTCSVWGGHGYMGDTTWDGIYVQPTDALSAQVNFIYSH